MSLHSLCSSRQDSTLPAVSGHGYAEAKAIPTRSFFKNCLSDLKKDPVTIHKFQYKEKHKEVTEGDHGSIPLLAEIRFQSPGQRTHYGSEADYFSENISRYGIHSVYFQPLEAATVAFAVYPVIEKSHQDETVAARKQRHASCPYTFDDRRFKTPDKRNTHKSQTNQQ